MAPADGWEDSCDTKRHLGPQEEGIRRPVWRATQLKGFRNIRIVYSDSFCDSRKYWKRNSGKPGSRGTSAFQVPVLISARRTIGHWGTWATCSS